MHRMGVPNQWMGGSYSEWEIKYSEWEDWLPHVKYNEINNEILWISVVPTCNVQNGFCAQNCAMVLGVAVCSCDTGFTLSGNGHSCNGKL